jgi:hypothetical protein
MKKIIIALLGLLLTACETEIDLTLPDNEPRLVVEGNVYYGLNKPINKQQIRLSLSANYTSNELSNPITNAAVSVSDGTAKFVYAHVGNGVYEAANFPAKPGTTYQLTILYANQTFQATEKLISGPALDSIGVKFFPSSFGSPVGDFLVLHMTDPVDEKNFYLWKLFINDSLKINPSPGNALRAIQKDNFFNGQRLINYLPYDNFPVVKGDYAEMQQLNISESMFNYCNALFGLTSAEGLSLAGDLPPGNIKGNIKNISNPKRDGLGYFGACSISILSKQIK